MVLRAELRRARGLPVLPATLMVESVMLGFAFVLGIALAAPPFASFRLTLGALGAAALGVLPSLVLVPWSMRTDWHVIKEMRDLVLRRLMPRLAPSSAPALLAISLAAGIGEEALFRGVLQTGVGQLVGPAVGLLFASALFGLVHPLSRSYVLLAGLVGAYLGGLLLLTGNLLVPMLVHAAHDFIALRALAGAMGDGAVEDGVAVDAEGPSVDVL